MRIISSAVWIGLSRLVRGPRAVFFLAVFAGLLAPLSAQVVIPTGYTATPGEGQAQGGSYNYFDDTGHQLTDGVFGVNDWTANLGHGNAYEWVGWISVDPSPHYSRKLDTADRQEMDAVEELYEDALAEAERKRLKDSIDSADE